MKAKVKKWGNSLGIRIPPFMVREFSLKDGSFVDIEDKEGEIIIRPKEGNTLSALLREINDENIHGEVETNGPVGNEAW